LPILSNVLLRAVENRLELTATDLDVTICCAVTAQVIEPGATTLPARKLFSIVREMGALELELEVDDKNKCGLSGGSSVYRIHGLAAEEYPPVPTFKDERKISLDQAKIKAMLRRTCFAASADESRYVLNGIFMSLKEHKVTMVATDGRRLALVEEEVDVTEAGQGEVIVPSKAVSELNRLFQDKGTVEINYNENQAAFSLKDDKGSSILVITKLIEGSYPNYRQVIPSETKERVALAREDFLHALKRAELMTSDKQNSVKLSFTKHNLAISANTPDVGESRETMAVNYSGKDIAIAFNPGYLIEPLNALTEDEVYLDLIDELSPGVVKTNGPYLYVVMPMRLS
jgi:DNA polymerase-3 subunit beta